MLNHVPFLARSTRFKDHIYTFCGPILIVPWWVLCSMNWVAGAWVAGATTRFFNVFEQHILVCNTLEAYMVVASLFLKWPGNCVLFFKKNMHWTNVIRSHQCHAPKPLVGRKDEIVPVLSDVLFSDFSSSFDQGPNVPWNFNNCLLIVMERPQEFKRNFMSLFHVVSLLKPPYRHG